MIFKFDSCASLVDKTRNINAQQYINPFNMASITDLDEAYSWMRNFLYFQFNAYPIYFNVEVFNNGNTVKELNINHVYDLVITESQGILNGIYNIIIENERNNENLELELLFINGIAKFQYAFNSKGKYIVNFNNDFFIGKNKYISIISDIETVSFLVNNDNKAINLQ